MLFDLKPDCIITSPPFFPKDLDLPDEETYMDFYCNFILAVRVKAKDYVLVFNRPTRRSAIYNRTEVFEEITWIRAPCNYKYKTQPIFIYKGYSPSFNFRQPMWANCLWHEEEGGIGFVVPPILNSPHPYEDPIDIYTYLLRMQKAGNPNTALVYDPFAGLGTSGVASLKLNLNWAGSEINPTYYQLAKSRLDRTLSGDDNQVKTWAGVS